MNVIADQAVLPTISVILSVYNGEPFIADALRSIMVQNYPATEIIVVNDGSTDDTIGALEPYMDKFTYLYHDNMGVAFSLNRALAECTGSLITFIDADDVWTPDKLSSQLAILNSNPKVDIVMDLAYETITVPDNETDYDEKCIKYLNLRGASLIRRSVFDRVGIFDNELIMGEDADWFFRAREKNVNFYIQRRVGLFLRRFGESLTSNKVKFNYYCFLVLKKTKERRKAQGIIQTENIPPPQTMDDLIKLWHMLENN